MDFGCFSNVHGGKNVMSRVALWDMRLAIAPGPTVHWLFRSHDLSTTFRSIQCSSVAHVLHV